MATTGDPSPQLNPQAPPFTHDPTEDIRARLTNDFCGLPTGDKAALQNIVDLNVYLLARVKDWDSINGYLKSELKSAQLKISNLVHELTYMRHEYSLLKQQLALTEDATRILFLRVEGLYENNGENLLTYVTSMLSRTGISCTVNDIDYVKRTGKRKQGSTRPVLVKFLNEYKRNMILYNRSNLNRNSNSLIWINDDVSDFTRRQRKTVRDIAAIAKTAGHTDLKVHGDGLVVGNGKFKHQDLDLLPSHLSVANAKQPSNETDLYFQSEHSPFFNFFSSPIYDGFGTSYNSAEQFFQHKKASFHGYIYTASKIMLTRDPYELKRLGNLVQMTQEWKDTEEDIMLNILRSKFTQNPTSSLTLTNYICTKPQLTSNGLQGPNWPQKHSNLAPGQARTVWASYSKTYEPNYKVKTLLPLLPPPPIPLPPSPWKAMMFHLCPMRRMILPPLLSPLYSHRLNLPPPPSPLPQIMLNFFKPILQTQPPAPSKTITKT